MFKLCGQGYSTFDVVVYLMKKLGGRVKGIKKLMKLMFLIQYEKTKGTIVKYLYRGKPITRAEFYIWSYGPLSNEVYDAVEGGLEVDDSDIPVTVKLPQQLNVESVENRLPEAVKRRIESVIRMYGELQGFELERIAVKMLELDEFKKQEYMGSPVDNYIVSIFGKERFNITDLYKKSS